ncbi:MAG: ATP-binding protein [Armatimonadota bacterium]
MPVKEVAIKFSEGMKDLPKCRELTEKSAAEIGFTGKDKCGIVSAVFEACVNAITHGWKAPDKYAKLTIRLYDDRLEAVVEDHGCGCIPSPANNMPPPASRRGRGIPLMKKFMDKIEFDNSDGCKVILTKYLPEK